MFNWFTRLFKKDKPEPVVETVPALVPKHRMLDSSTEAVIAEWRAEMLKHPVGSPKHTAFSNRLKELGAL